MVLAMELALTPDFRWDIDADDLVAAARDGGFDAVGMTTHHAGAGSGSVLTSAGFRCHELLALMLGADDSSNLRQARRMAEAAAEVNADWVLTAFMAPLTTDTRSTLAQCASMFAEVGAKMAVEFTPFGEVNSIPAALEVVEVAGADRAGVMIDTWHFFRGSSTWADLEAVPLERIAYVQFDDALDPTSDDAIDETMNKRVMPGDGTFELERFASALRDRGWDGVVSVEVLNRELLELPVSEFARMAAAKTAPYWR